MVVVVVVYFLTEFLSRDECNDSRKSLLSLVFTPVAKKRYVLASGFGMLFYWGADIKTALSF